MARRAQWSEHEARSALIAWRKSALSIERFATGRDLVTHWWKSQLVRSPSALALLPVHVTESAPTKRGEPVAVYLRTGHSVKVGHGFDEEAFARVVALLEGR